MDTAKNCNLNTNTMTAAKATTSKSSVRATGTGTDTNAMLSQDGFHPPPLLSLPFELRHQMYKYIFDPAPAVTIVAFAPVNSSSYQRPGLQGQRSKWTPTSSTRKTKWPKASPSILSILYTCRLLYREGLPHLHASLNLHITFSTIMSHTSTRFLVLSQQQLYQPSLTRHVPINSLSQLQHVTYHFPIPDPYGPHSRGSPSIQRTNTNPITGNTTEQLLPARTPFPFHLTPNLKRFVMQKPFFINLDTLYEPEYGRLTRARYEGFSEIEKVEVWRKIGVCDVTPILGAVARFGRGGWVSALALPDVYGFGIRTGKRQGSVNENETSSDGEERDAIETAAETEGAATLAELDGLVDESGLGVPLSCDITVEADMMLFAGQSWRPMHIETLVVEVGTKEKNVRAIRFVDSSKEKMDEFKRRWKEDVDRDDCDDDSAIVEETDSVSEEYFGARVLDI